MEHPLVPSKSCSPLFLYQYHCWWLFQHVTLYRGRSRIFFRRGCTRLLLYFSTNKPHSFFIFWIPVVLENRRSSPGRGGGVHPLHPPPRSAPAIQVTILSHACFLTTSVHSKSIQCNYSPGQNSRSRTSECPLEQCAIPYVYCDKVS